jgi:hypothetical protein
MFSSYLTGNTLRLFYEYQPINAVRGTITVYYENKSKHENKLYGQNSEFRCVKAGGR